MKETKTLKTYLTQVAYLNGIRFKCERLFDNDLIEAMKGWNMSQHKYYLDELSCSSEEYPDTFLNGYVVKEANMADDYMSTAITFKGGDVLTIKIEQECCFE